MPAQGGNRNLRVDAGQPLGVPPQVTKDEKVAGYMSTFDEASKLNANPVTRGQVREKRRAEALEGYMRGQYLTDHDIDPTIDFTRSR